MAKNRKTSKKMTVAANSTMVLGSVLVSLFVMVVINMLANSTCSQLRKSIGAKENQLERLNDDCSRENASWAQMTETRRLERALQQHGLAMRPAKPAQNVRMSADGQFEPAQLSVAKLAQRANGSSAAACGGARRNGARAFARR